MEYVWSLRAGNSTNPSGVVIVSLAGKFSCTAEALRRWVRQHDRDTGQSLGATTAEQERGKTLEREVKELRRTNEISRLASAFFAQTELDRRFKS